MLVRTTPRIALTRARFSPISSARAPRNENRQDATRLGLRFSGNPGDLRGRVHGLFIRIAARPAWRQRRRTGVWHCRLCVHDICRAPRRAQTRPDVASRPRTSVDARPSLARVPWLTDDSFSRWISFRRNAHASADVAAHHYSVERRFRRSVAALYSALDDYGRAAG